MGRQEDESPSYGEPRETVGPGPSARVAVGLLIAVLAPALAAQGTASSEPDAPKAWQEIEVAFPAYPRPEKLVPFPGGPANGHRYFVDPVSLSIGADRVVRYTLVIRTAGGATNVSYEGMRCDERQQKTYATGQANGSWARSRDPQWRRIEYRSVNNHHGVLYTDFLCREREPPDSVEQVLRRLREPPPRPFAGD